jgi:SAM-dependent methyltransferase
MSTARQTIHDLEFEAVVSRLWETDIRRMIEQHAGRFLDVDCPACDSTQRAPLCNAHGLEYHRCLACGAAYISPRPPADVVRQFYAEAESLRFWRESMPPALRTSRKQHLYTSRALYLNEQIRRFRPEARTLLEIGAGNGEMAEKVLALTPIREVILLEPQPLELSLPGARVVPCRLEDYAGSELVDVVLAFEVLEHIPDPVGFAARARSLLAPGGIFIFSTPNVAGFELVTLGKLSSTFVFDHVCLHTPRSLETLLGRAGLDVLDLQTPGELDVQSIRIHYEKGDLDLSGNPALKFLLEQRADEGFQAFLRQHKLSSHVKCVARKAA